jgi:hypothetical protein
LSRNSGYFVPVLLLLLAVSVSAETAAGSNTATSSSETKEWIVAAEEFSATDLPPMYKNLSATIPSLILSRISGIDSRLIVMDEQKSRDMQELSDKRISLVKERAALVLERDQILLSPDTRLVKNRKKRELTDKITDKEASIKTFDEKIKTKLSEYDPDATTVMPVKVWAEKKLYVRAPDVTLAKSLATSKISGLITGTMQDIAGYLYVTASLETGIAEVPVVSVSEASAYDEVDSLAQTLAARLLPELARRTSVQIRLSVEPETARVFIDGRLINRNEDSATVFAGEHTVSASAPGYKTATKKGKFEGNESFAVTIRLEEAPTIPVAFDTKGSSASIYIGSQYYGETPVDITLPDSSSIGLATVPAPPPIKGFFSFLNPPVNEKGTVDDISTWFVFRPDQIDSSHPAKMAVVLNKIDTKTRIDRQRDILYWSLGGLYLSLPVSMISYGVCMDMYRAYTAGSLKYASDYSTWVNVAKYSQYVSIGLGVNLAFQLVQYFITIEQATPKTVQQEK